MHNPLTNDDQASALEMLDSLRHIVARLEAEVKTQAEENARIRAERDDLRKIIHEHLKKSLSNPKDWNDFDPKNYTLTIHDLLQAIE